MLRATLLAVLGALALTANAQEASATPIQCKLFALDVPGAATPVHFTVKPLGQENVL